MSRYTGAVCRLCRREGEKLYLKGDRCYTNKCSVDRRTYPPGVHGQGRRKFSEYGIQLREKQKLRRIYGVNERQMRNYYENAAKQRGITGEILLQLLELRLDNIVYRLGIASSRPQARQLVMHGHIQVNGRKVDVPSYQVQPGDVISVKETSRNLDLIKANLENVSAKSIPEWLEINPEKLEGQVKVLPKREDLDLAVQEHLIVEYYSK